ncbi:MAG: hypothetical protein KAR20_26635, partial [Candidatus Heimdallarchaeota archaeon]|nr:hypothetical protein [Candidatus Heimdallarchaeota archaeon]
MDSKYFPKEEKKMAQKMIKGIPYDVEEGQVVLHKEDGDVTLPLEWGKNAYSICHAYLNRKGSGRRGGNGIHVIGNFTYVVALEGEGEDAVSVMTVTRKDESVLGTLTLTEAQAKYPRNAAIKFVMGTIE